jgi:hypothetical protein
LFGLLALAWGLRWALGSAAVLINIAGVFTLSAPSGLGAWAPGLAVGRAVAGAAVAVWLLVTGGMVLSGRFAASRVLRPVLLVIILLQAVGWLLAILPELPATLASPLALYYKGTLSGLATLSALAEIGMAWACRRYLSGRMTCLSSGAVLLAAAVWWREGLRLLLLPTDGRIWWQVIAQGHYPPAHAIGLTLAIVATVCALFAGVYAGWRLPWLRGWVRAAALVAITRQAWQLVLLDVSMLPRTTAGMTMSLNIILSPVLIAIEYLALMGIAGIVDDQSTPQSPAESPR